MVTVGVVETGVANAASVRTCLERAGLACRPVTDSAGVDVSGALVLPGVGAIAAAMARIDELGIRSSLIDRVRAGRPTLCVCLGMQALFEWSEEGEGTRGLGVAPGVVRRFGAGVLTPQLGWNCVGPRGGGMVETGYAYYANSYRADAVGDLEADGWRVSVSDHGGEFVGAMERGGVLACQFHPELSGAWGAGLIGRWARASGVIEREEAPCSRRV